MQCGPARPTHCDAGLSDRIAGQPEVADSHQAITRVQERQAVAHPGHDTFFLK